MPFEIEEKAIMPFRQHKGKHSRYGNREMKKETIIIIKDKPNKNDIYLKDERALEI